MKTKFLLFLTFLIFSIFVFFVYNFIVRGCNCKGSDSHAILYNGIYYELLIGKSIKPYCGILKSDKNGLRSVIEYKYGVKHGIEKKYFENGNVQLEAHYNNSLLHGEFIGWYENGMRAIHMSYLNGAENGERQALYRNGSPYLRMNYKDDKKDGEFMIWYQNDLPQEQWAKTGTLKEVGWYKENQKIKFVTFDESGVVTDKSRIK